jgi:hypothetical protein
MNRPYLSFSLTLLLAVSALPAHAWKQTELRFLEWSALSSPELGTLCDRYVCANDKGLSHELTEKYLGAEIATKRFSHGDLDLTLFTFANGISCSVNERLCREDRYYGADGKRSGAVNKKYSGLLFGAPQNSEFKAR